MSAIENHRLQRRRDLIVSLVALALLLAWDASGSDLLVARWAGSIEGFAWRDAWWASRGLHDGGRLMAWLLLAVLVASAVQAGPRASAVASDCAPTASERWRWLGVMLLCLLLVPALKRISATSCAWDLAEFGGVALYVSHWQWGTADGGPGHCFPSGHAVAAFAFLGHYFLWRSHDLRRARWWLAAVLATGALFGAAQLVRGAHYPSHTLWSAWLCWSLCVAAQSFFNHWRIDDGARRTEALEARWRVRRGSRPARPEHRADARHGAPGGD